MYMIIGGVERDISQVESFAEYHGGDLGNMTAEEIFYGARAEKLFEKILQKVGDQNAIAISRGEPVHLPPIDRPAFDSFEGGTNLEKAKNAELFYAKQAAFLVER